ncbi:MAG: HAMP domain-containing protein [Desulfuromonas sp.]|nr:HAMP domain-containing protein [Desulfuromonas sp.]
MFKMTLHRKILLAFLALALCPLLLLILSASHSLQSVESLVRQKAAAALDKQAAQALVLRAEQVADQVSGFLYSIESDLDTLAMLPANPSLYRRFYRSHQRLVWQGGADQPEGRTLRLPLYHELAFINIDGREQLRLVDGQSDTCRDHSQPGSTRYISEDFFAQVLQLHGEDVYVGALVGWHVSRDQQLAGARYQGMIRFCRKVYDDAGQWLGVVMLALDHVHLMEFTRHISSGANPHVLEASYAEGNYAFMFDNEGWIVAHPKYWDIRGLDRNGEQVGAYRGESPAGDDGRRAYNLFQAGAIHINYPHAARQVVNGLAGIVDVTNVGGAQKVMAYAPVRYQPRGQHSDGQEGDGVWGGITIGAESESFHRASLATSADIRRHFNRFWQQGWGLIGFSLMLLLAAAQLLSSSVTRPLKQLIHGTRQMAQGRLAAPLAVQGSDEIATLTEAFNRMVAELHQRRERLGNSLLELRRSRSAIRSERNFTRTVVENIDTGIITLDRQGYVTSMNQPVQRILCLETRPLHAPLADVLRAYPEIAEQLPEVVRREDVSGWSRYFECPRQGRILTLRLALFPFASAADDGLILTVEDLTERAQMRVRMARMERLASLGRLSAGLAHEIRNPLTGISLLLDDLHDRLLHTPQDQELIRRALEEMERLEGLVGDLLNFSRLSACQCQPGDLRTVLERTLLLFEQQCQRSGVVIARHFADSLPVVDLDEQRLQQAFLNLLRNALEAMPDGGTLQLTLRHDGDSVCLLIADNGIGMSEEQRALIFEPFFTCKKEGNGLGLSIVYNIITEHNGRIEVTSQPGCGSCFEMCFPVSTSLLPRK